MFGKRLLSGMVLVIILALLLIPGGDILLGASFVLSLIAYRELMKACKLSGYLKKEGPFFEGQKNLIGCFSGIELLGYLGIAVYYCILRFCNDSIYCLLTVFGILVAFMFVYVFTFPKYEAKDIMRAFFCLVYGPLMLTFIYSTREYPEGIYFVWMIFICSWISDTMAYCVGMLFGKHRLAPVLSPKKSIEGAIGGVVGAGLVGFLYAYFWVTPHLVATYGFSNMVTVRIVIICLIGAVVTQVGDLAASGIKRNEGIKDYGKLIPGHGGIMDRFDSVIFAAPMIYLLTLIFIEIESKL